MMIVSLIQTAALFGEPQRNFEKAERLMEKAAERPTDVLVLPELWNTGFFPREGLSELADENAARTNALCGAFAAKHRVNVLAGSVTEQRNGGIYNALYAFDRTGAAVGSYDKVHLFSPSGENHYYTAGDHLGLFRLDGINCGAVICYDIRFPELTRAMALKGLDVLFIVAQWPVQRLEQLHALAKARAIENQCFVCLCNGCGTAPGTTFAGGSCVFSPLGETLAMADGTEQIITAELDLPTLTTIRETINVFRDRRTDMLSKFITV